MTMSFYILNDNFDYFLEANPFLLEILMIGRIVTTSSSIIHAFKQQSLDANCHCTSPNLLIRPLLSHSGKEKHVILALAFCTKVVARNSP